MNNILTKTKLKAVRRVRRWQEWPTVGLHMTKQTNPSRTLFAAYRTHKIIHEQHGWGIVALLALLTFSYCISNSGALHETDSAANSVAPLWAILYLKFPVIDVDIACFQDLLQLVFVPLILTTLGAMTTFYFTIEQNLWQSWILHANDMANPS